MKLINNSLLAAASLLFASTSQAEIVSYDFTLTSSGNAPFSGATVDAGFTGTTGSGAITFDDELIFGIGEEVLGPNEFDLEFTLFGQTFDESDDVAYPDLAGLNFFDGDIVGLDYFVTEIPSALDPDNNFVAIDEPGLFNFLILDLEYNDLSGQFEGDLFLNVELTAVPVPAAAWLFDSGLLGLVGLARRRKA